MKHWSMSSQLKALRAEVGLPCYAHIPMRIVPDDLFTDTSTYSHEGWPDLAATDIADWPGSLKSLDGAIPQSSDVGLALAFCGSIPPDNADCLQLFRHNTSGCWRESLRFAGVPLELSTSGSVLGSTLARKWHGTSVAARFAPLEAIEEYRNSLKAFGLDCNECFQHFAEGSYPVDLDDGSLERLSTVYDFRELPFPVEQLESACLLILAPNSA